MTIQLRTPPPGGWVGPGYLIDVATDVFGPFPEPYAWHVDVESAVGPKVLTGVIGTSPPTSVFSFILYGSGQPVSLVGTPGNAANFSADAQITAWMTGADQSIFIDGPTTFGGIFWDPYGGLGSLIFNKPTGTSTVAASQLLAIYQSVVMPTWSTAIVRAGLTLEGTVQLGDTTRAVGWQIVTFPQSPHVDPGLPDYFFNLGFITPLIGGRYDRSRRVTFEQQILILPESCHAVSYDLAPGVAIDLTELVPPAAPS